MNSFEYSKAGLSLKMVVTFFLLFVGIGYVFGLINIYNNMGGFSYTGIVVHYRGSETELTMPPEFAFSKLIQEHHVHLFGLSMVFLAVGMLFVMTRLPEKIKTFFVAMPFLGMFLDFAGSWLTVFSSPLFGWFMIVFGGIMALSFFMIIGRPLYEMWILPIFQRTMGNRIPWYLS